jgi:hypothetical protein
MFNFKPKIEGKRPEPIVETENQDTSIEKEGNFLTPEKIKAIYERGRLFILATIISMGMFPAEKSGEEGLYDNFEAKFKNIPPGKGHIIFDDINKILKLKEASIYFAEDSDSALPTAILDDHAREVMIKLSSMFEFKSWDVDVNFGHNEDEKEIIKIDNENLWKKLEELRKEFPLGATPDVSSIPYSRPEYLNDPIFFQGLKRLASIEMATDAEFCNKEEIKKVATDDSFYELLKKLNSSNTRFTAEVVGTLAVTGEKPEEVTQQYWQSLLDRRQNLEKFLTSGPNRKVLEYGQGVELGMSVLEDIMDDETGKYVKFFEDKKNQKSIEFLDQNGYNFESMMFLLRSDYENMINEPAFLDVLEELKMININSDKFSVWFHLLSKNDSYYNLDSKEGFEDLRDDLRRIRYYQLGDLNDFYKVRDALDERNEKYKKTDERVLKQNIFQPLTTQSDTAKENWDNFSEDPALNIVSKLGYQYKDAPKYLDALDEFTKADWVMRVARNMYITRMPVTPENFEQTFYEIVGLRTNKELLEKPLFKNRNVALFAHSERYGDDKKYSSNKYVIKNKGNIKFGKPAVRNAILQQNPINLTTFRAENTQESLAETKKLFLEYVGSKKNLTIVADAHGGKGQIFFTQGLPKKKEVKSSVSTQELEYVTTEELASALEQRYDKEIKDTAIILMSSCYDQDFIRDLCEKIMEINSQKKKDIPLPIASGDAEYGQYAFSAYNDFGSEFLALLLTNKFETKIKDIIQIESGEDKITNISLFVPFTKETKDNNKKTIKQKVFYQITHTPTTPLDKTLALQYAEDLINKNINEKTASYWAYKNPEWSREIRKIVEENSYES